MAERGGWLRRMATALRGEPTEGLRASPELSIADTRRSVSALLTLYPYNPDDLAQRKGGLRVYDTMRLDNQVRACLGLTKAAITGSGWSLEPADESTQAHDAAEALTEDLQRMTDGRTFSDVMWEVLTALDYGFSVSEIVWAIEDGRLRVGAVKTRAPHDIDFQQEDTGAILSIQQRYGATVRTMPVERFVLLTIGGEFANPYGTSELRCVYREWWFKEMWAQWWAMFGEKLAIPPVKGHHPPNITPERQAEVQARLANMQAGGAYMIPEGWDIDLLQAAVTTNRDTFQTALDYYNLQLARGLLVPEKSGYGGGSDQGGSYALAREQMGAFFFVLERRRDHLVAVLQRQLIDRMALAEVGPNQPPPRLCLEPLQEENRTAIGDLYVRAVTQGAVMPRIEDENYFRATVLRFPEREETPEEAATREAGNAPEAPPENDEVDDAQVEEDPEAEAAYREARRRFAAIDPTRLPDALRARYGELQRQLGAA